MIHTHMGWRRDTGECEVCRSGRVLVSDAAKTARPGDAPLCTSETGRIAHLCDRHREWPWRLLILALLLTLSACSAPPGPPPVVWDMVEDPELLQEAASLLCDATDGEHCPATIKSGGTRHVTFSDALQDCGLCEWHGLWIVLRTEPCPAQVGDGVTWSDASDRRAMTIVLAHELGHSIWGPEHDGRFGALMQPRVGQYYMPLLLPDGE